MNRPASKASCRSEGATSAADALLALQAFEPAVALLDLTHQLVRWCSARFITEAGLEPGDPLAVLLARVPGARHAIDGLSTALAVTPVGGVRAVRVAPGLVAVGLADASLSGQGDELLQAQAAQRCDRLVQATSALSVSQLAATLAHEINQPLGAVVNVLHGLRSRLAAVAAGPLDAAQAEALAGAVGLALEQARYAARLAARHRRPLAVPPVLAALDPTLPVQRALGLLSDELARSAVQVRWLGPWQGTSAPAPAAVLGDALMLQQVFVNLARNAIESMKGLPRAGRCLDVQLAGPASANEWTVSLRDRGCGWPPGADPAVPTPGHSTKPGGLGLGICRAIVAAHRGRLWCTPNATGPEPGPGTTFHVALPLRHAQSHGPAFPLASACLT